MNAASPGGFRRDEGSRGKRGDGRRQNANSFMDSNWKSPRTIYTVDTSKLKVAATQKVIYMFLLKILIIIARIAVT